jgi:hypothetical protein
LQVQPVVPLLHSVALKLVPRWVWSLVLWAQFSVVWQVLLWARYSVVRRAVPLAPPQADS